MESKEANINVVVRVRPRNQKEIKENSLPIVYSNPKTKEITIKQGSENNNSSKTYTFDKVFGPESTQESLFDEVVNPILQEVMMGYNCTIFAYGQTGTGKTHTMEGNLDDIQGIDAGIIPRTLYKLFEILETVAEFSVRVSCLELYNEELNDLLSTDESKKLRIFEDLNRKGSVLIQNLEEVLVKNAIDVIHTLQCSSLKRQTASTKMNEVSSRSHCIFSITVHIKETTSDGEDLLKVGKLNLVDLAGSENIGRSGAENKRAKEAGMINQSLLTLGRVINALVERSPHVPYRESKLTRLLQDSLGGKTKTCIIAAISPAKCNMDETLSTLDYAHRAKNIRNKPEINQKMTKRTLIKDYVTEIERLKSDLSATREKNGIFMSSESYTSLMEQNESRKVHIDEINRSIIAKEEQMSHLEAKFRQNTELLTTANAKIDMTLIELEKKKLELEETINNLKLIRLELMEQKAITRAHAATEKKLDNIASELVISLKESLKSIKTLHEKIERKELLEGINMNTYGEVQNMTLKWFEEFALHLSEIKEGTSGYCTELVHLIEDALVHITEFNNVGITGFEQRLNQMVVHINSMKRISDNCVKSSTADTVNFQQILLATDSALKGVFFEMRSALEEIIIEFIGFLNTAISDIHSQFTEVQKNYNGIIYDYSMLHNKHFQHLLATRERITNNAQLEIGFLREENKRLLNELEKEKLKTKTMHIAIKNSFNCMMDEYGDQVDASMNAIANYGIDNSNRMSEKITLMEESLSNSHQLHLDSCVLMNEKIAVKEQMIITYEEKMKASLASIPIIRNEYQNNVLQSLEDYSHVIQAKGKENIDINEAAISERMKDSLEFTRSLQEEYGLVDEQIFSVKSFTQDHHNSELKYKTKLYNEILLKTTIQRATLATAHDIFLSSLESSTLDIKAKELITDAKSGNTPRKSDTPQIPVKWQLTKGHKEIIEAFRNADNDTDSSMASEMEIQLQSKLPRMSKLSNLVSFQEDNDIIT